MKIVMLVTPLNKSGEDIIMTFWGPASKKPTYVDDKVLVTG